ncbi:unnamed protein product [Brassica rapa]|uniref:Uncharacterized protein n=1 Tax=Brassica campestris TaxID=3711 RepID=A0A3P6CS31_BRACM|nr:unnamed protein product [Brassica rapa]VDD17380.1 unnamed protein product [Brassica rapa]
MAKTNRGKLKSKNDSELPWMAKGSKSLTRRDEKAIVRVADSDVENKDKSSSGTIANESEPGNLLGQHVAETALVPMKKQRMMVASPSPRNGPDFSGIALLADAACNLSNDLAPAVDILPESEKSSFDLADEKGTASVGGMIVATKGPTESENLAPDSGVLINSDKSSVKDDASEKDVKGAITNPMPPRESEPIDGSKYHLDGFAASAGQVKFSSPCGPKDEAAARNGNKFKPGYSSPLEDGELREPYRRGKNKVKDEGFYSMAKNNDNKMKDYGKGILAETNLGPLERKSHDALRIGEAHDRRDVEKNDVARMSDLHLKKRSSSSRRSDDNEDLSMSPYNCFGRHDRSSGRGYFRGSGSRLPYVLEPPHPENLGMMGRFDQSGSGSGQGSQPDGYVRKRFSNGGYRGGRFSNGGDHVMRGRHGDNNQFSGRMHNWRSGNRRERRNSPVFRRSRSRSPVQWNGGDRLSHPHDGFRAEERMMESVRFPFQERFLEDQEIGFMSPPRNRMPPPGFDERRSHGTNRNSFRGRRFGLGQRHDAGRSLRRLNSDNSNNFIPFRRQRRFDGVEDSTGGNKFEVRQQQTRRADIDGVDDVAGSGFAKESRGCNQKQQRRRKQRG